MIPRTPPRKNACKEMTVVIDANVKPINKKLKQVRKLAKKINKELERTTELLSHL